jgi:hypothetical protein
MPKLLCLSILCLVSVLCYGQFDSLGLKSEWNKGFLILNNGTQFSGLIQNNVRLGLIKFKANSKEGEQSFLDRNIKMVEYFDSETSKTRRFARFNTKDLNSPEGRIKEEVFEILMEFSDFAILSKTYPVNPLVKRYTDGYGASTAQIVGYEQNEGIYSVNEEGLAERLLMVVSVEKLHQKKPAKVRGMYDEKLIKKCMGSEWPRVQAYIKKKKLVLNKKADLLKAFEYYSEIK